MAEKEKLHGRASIYAQVIQRLQSRKAVLLKRRAPLDAEIEILERDISDAQAKLKAAREEN